MAVPTAAEQRADGARAHLQPVPHPLHGVREEKGAGEDHGERDEQKKEGRHARLNLASGYSRKP